MVKPTENYYSLISQCRSCGSKDFLGIYDTKAIPIAGLYYDNNSEPLNIKAPLTLICCKSCGLIQLKETISSDIYSDYSFSGTSSSSYQKYLENFATKLVKEWSIANKKIFEIGASNGVLLKYLQDIGKNKVTGIEPSKKLCNYAIKDGVNVQQGYFDKKFIIKNNIGSFDCIIIRHVLEHIDDLNDMADSLRMVIKEYGILVVEVPNVEKIFDKYLFSNIFHEHLNYFSTNCLNNLLYKFGFFLVHEEEVDIHGGSIVLIYKKNGKPVVNCKSLTHERIVTFKEKANKYYSYINKKIKKLNFEKKVVHGYGASHRTFVLLGNASLSYYNIPVFYDNNPFIHNKRLNGFHSLILSTDYILNDKPETIVIFAISYEDEIRDLLYKKYNYEGEIISLKYEGIN